MNEPWLASNGPAGEFEMGGSSGMNSGDPDRVARDLFDWSRRLVGIDGGILFVHDDNGLVPSHTFEVPPRILDGLELDPDIDGPVQRTLRHGVTEVISGAIHLSPGQSTRTPWATTVCVPLTIEDSRIGVFLAGWSAPYDIGRETTLVLEGAAAMAASAIYGARLLHEVKREQQRLRLLVDRLPIPALQFSEPDFVLTHLNAQARDLFSYVDGQTMSALLGRIDIQPVDGPPITGETAQRNLLSATPARRIRVTTEDGVTRTIHPHIARFGTGGGVIMLVDMTIEASLEAQRQRFVRMFSHHLRTPLTPLVGYAELLQNGNGGKKAQRQAALEMGRAAAEILSHVNRLEQISNLQLVDQGSLETVPVSKLIAAAWDSASGDPDDLETTGDDTSLVRCAPDHIVTAMAEIITNAYAHGQPPVRVCTVPSKDTVQIEFEDAGAGIPDDWASAVFTPYVDANAGYVAPAGGRLGLGLSLARGLTEASHGELTYEAGRFVFRLLAVTGPD
ncbi:MAG: sensor histidine kinase [Acidimicrobiia bacterium]